LLHYRLIHSLAFTIQADDKLILQFDMFRKKRNISDYMRAGEVSDLEVREMIALAKSLRIRAAEWIKTKSASHNEDYVNQFVKYSIAKYSHQITKHAFNMQRMFGNNFA